VCVLFLKVPTKSLGLIYWIYSFRGTNTFEVGMSKHVSASHMDQQLCFRLGHQISKVSQLVGGFNSSEKYDNSSVGICWDYEIPIWKVIKRAMFQCSKAPPTRLFGRGLPGWNPYIGLMDPMAPMAPMGPMDPRRPCEKRSDNGLFRKVPTCPQSPVSPQLVHCFFSEFGCQVTCYVGVD